MSEMTPCAKKGCELEGTKVPRLKLYANRRIWPEIPPCLLVIGIALCEAHAAEVTVPLLVGPEEFARVTARIAAIGKVSPDYDATEVDFIGTDDRMFLMTRNMERPTTVPEPGGVH